MDRANELCSVEVGDCAGNFQNTGVGAGAELEGFKCGPQQGFGIAFADAEGVDLLLRQLGVAVDLVTTKAVKLDLAGLDNAVADGSAGFAGT